MGQTRSLCIGLALLMSQATVAYAADLGLPPPPPPPEPCVGCVGPWYLKGFVGMANPHVGGLDYELFGPNFEFIHEDIKSTPLFGLGFGYDTGHWFRFDITGEYRGKGLFIAQDRYRGPTGSLRSVLAAARMNTRPISKAGSGCSTPISISAPGIA